MTVKSVLGSSVATNSAVKSLTTFLSRFVVASLFSESNSFSVTKLFYWPSSAVASTNATFSEGSVSDTTATHGPVCAAGRSV